MKRSILIASGKGGVGKSSVAVRLGKIFAESGVKTLLIDCDAGLGSLDIMLGYANNNVFSWYDAYKGTCSSADAVIHSDTGPDLLPAPHALIPEQAPDAVSKVLGELKDDYDIVIVDAPAGISTGLTRAANAVKQAIIIATADDISVRDAAALDKTVRDCGVRDTRLLINRYELKAAKKGKLLPIDDIIDKTCVQLIGVIPEDKEVVYSVITGKVDPKSKSFKAAARISKRIRGENIPLSLSLLK